VLGVVLHADGAHAEKLWVNAGGSAFRPYFDASMAERGQTMPVLDGREVFRMAVSLMPQVVLEVLSRHGMTISTSTSS